MTSLHRINGFLTFVLGVLSVPGVVETVLVRGFLVYEPARIQAAARVGYSAVIVLYLLWVALRIVEGGWNLRAFLADLVLSVLLIGLVFPLHVGGSIVCFRMLAHLTGMFSRATGISAFLSEASLNPARLLLLSFVGTISVGVILLMLPAATADRRGTAFIDALFTSTSATCVTGLIVRDTGTYFSGFGQAVVLVLIQVGGLGIMTLSTLFAIIFGKRLGFRQEEQMRDILDQTGMREMYRLIGRIVGITLVFESVGAALLFLKWLPGMGVDRALKSAVFHSVSAFCNAGFSLDSGSLTAYVGDWYVNAVFMGLIIFGGLGFVVIDDVMENSRNLNPFSVRWSRLTVHSKLVLITTASLIVAGMMTVFFFEFDNTMLGLSTMDKLLASLFQSVTFRTAGFNTIDIAGMRDETLLVGLLLMFIGASPASTGGGIKTTTFAVLLLSVRCLLRSRDEVELFGRTIHHGTIYKSIAIVLFSFTFLVVFIILLSATQQGGLMDIVFEAVSAIGTVGLSTGMTGRLDVVGKVLVSILMYVGRVGPLTVALALGEVRKVNIEYPKARITVG